MLPSHITHRSRLSSGTLGARTLALLTTMLSLGAVALTGCSGQSHVVGDRVWGEFVLAYKDTGDTKGPQVTVPPSMAGSVSTTQYKANGKIGTRVTFQQLNLGDFDQLGELIGDSYPNSAVSMQLTGARSGQVVRVRGIADLTPLSPQDDYVEFGIRFSGPVSATNGTQSANNTVVWKPVPGKSDVLTADATYQDPSTANFTTWTWTMAGIALIVVAIVILLAWRNRDRSPRLSSTQPPTPTGRT